MPGPRPVLGATPGRSPNSSSVCLAQGPNISVRIQANAAPHLLDGGPQGFQVKRRSAHSSLDSVSHPTTQQLLSHSYSVHNGQGVDRQLALCGSLDGCASHTTPAPPSSRGFTSRQPCPPLPAVFRPTPFQPRAELTVTKPARTPASGRLMDEGENAVVKSSTADRELVASISS
jgi:hypothetical protein